MLRVLKTRIGKEKDSAFKMKVVGLNIVFYAYTMNLAHPEIFTSR